MNSGLIWARRWHCAAGSRGSSPGPFRTRTSRGEGALWELGS